MAKKARGRRAGGLAALTTADLHAELERRRQRLSEERDRLRSELEAVEAEIEALGGVGGAGGGASRRGPGRPRGSGRARGGAGRRRAKQAAVPAGRKRPKNEQNLSDALVEVLKNKTMGVSEVAEAVQAAGYQTSSANFRTIVNQTLLKDPRIKKVSRGQYTAK